MAAAATSSRSAPTSGPASAWCAAAPARRWSAIPQTVAARIREYQDDRHRYLHPVRLSASRGSLSLRRAGVPAAAAGAAEQRDADPRQHRTVRRDHRQRIPAAETGIAVMSLIDSLPRVRRTAIAAGRRPDPVDRAARHHPGLAARLRHGLRARRGCCRRRATSRWRDGSSLLSGELVRNIWVSFWRASIGFLIGGSIGFAFGLANGLSQLSSQADRHDVADGAQHPASGADPAGHPVVRHRRVRKAVPGRARRVLPDLSQHAARHPHRRSAADRDGTHLRHDRRRIVPPGDLSGRAAVDLRRLALCARHHVADPDRGRDHRGILRPRLHGDAGARVHADRRRRALHPDLCAARQARRQRLARARAADAVLASGLSETLRNRNATSPSFSFAWMPRPLDRADFVEAARLLRRGPETPVARALADDPATCANRSATMRCCAASTCTSRPASSSRSSAAAAAARARCCG